ncbi:MAG: hypothetical protein Fur0025_10450 [Oscillatoriaceae cyanobacterium]
MSEPNMNTKSDSSQGDLAQKVEMLARELGEKDMALQEARQELERMRQHLLHVEKMSMLGEMVSGIAHEINNPINFIYGNLPYVEEHVEDLFSVLEAYDATYPDKKGEVEEVLEDVELDYIQEDLPRVVNSIKVGAERIRDLVISLRNFYRRDEKDMKPADLLAGIDSTLVLLNNRYKQNIEVVKQVEKIPQVECHINQINQVFMNVIGNAIDALLDKHWSEQDGETEVAQQAPKQKRRIEIAVKPSGKNGVLISVTDNGPGMPPEIRERVFEPFFTTKPIGVGTGLGLSISRQIVVETHGGRMECQSQPGDGTTFTVELPVSQGVRGEFAAER